MSESNVPEAWVKNWFCIRAKPKMENMAAASLSSMDSVEVFLPRTIRRKKVVSSPPKPLFPGYLFAKFDPVSLTRSVHFARGVAYVVRRNEVPVAISPEVIMELRLFSKDGILEIPDHPHKVGDKVKIIAGLFKGGEGEVTQLVPARERVRVLFELLGQPTEMEIDEHSLDFPSAHPMSSTG